MLDVVLEFGVLNLVGRPFQALFKEIIPLTEFVGDEYHSAEVIGVDLSPTQPVW